MAFEFEKHIENKDDYSFKPWMTDFDDKLIVQRPGNDLSLKIEGAVYLKEITTPTAISGYAAIYTKDVNELFFQDGSGAEHLLHGDSFSNLWFHTSGLNIVKDTVAISTANLFTLIDSFENIGEEDDLANAVSSTASDEITLGTNGAGKYKMTFHTSITSSGASSEMVIAMGITLATPLNITAATNATPIVITSAGHGLVNGDMITIAGATGNTGANGDWIVSGKTNDDITLIDLAGSNSVGNGAYNSGSGDIDILYPGNILMHRVVSQTNLGVGGANADKQLNAGDKVSLYVANIGATRDLEIAIVNMEIFRIGD